MRLRILMVCSELAPIAKVGGLADAVAGLAAALAERGHDVRVLLPRYGDAKVEIAATREDAHGGGHRYQETARASHDAPRIYLLDAPRLYPDERVYIEDQRDAERFLRLCGAALALGPAIGWNPQIVHCHDWHTALLPVMLRSPYAPSGQPTAASVLSLHNIAFQGVFAEDVLAHAGYPAIAELLEPGERGGNDGHGRRTVNFLRAGIRRADAITTVSPTYAQEIRAPELGMGLDDLLRERGARLHGILNGVDYSVWEPARDPLIGHNYDASDPSPKHRVKAALSAELGLPEDDGAPLIGMVSRLTWQKGIDLLIEALPELLAATDARFALLGSGEAEPTERLRAFAAAQPSRVSFTEGYDERLAHRILAGADLVLLPSRYEPCGLTQLYALRYGTIPVVRSTGGLADTVEHFDAAAGRGNGSVFGPYEPAALIVAVRRALEWYRKPIAWQQLMSNAMRGDFSWRNQVEQYERVYRTITPQTASRP